nr:hypothetical protein SYMBAF_10075 [Serratia symbiotica]
MTAHLFYYSSIEWISVCAVYGKFLLPGAKPGIIFPKRPNAAGQPIFRGDGFSNPLVAVAVLSSPLAA